ncbi:MAG: GNAT family N-acetyltransferase [Leptolyngbya sp. PLA3]|nr:MAG: GNAT family N-acetyltransferase [Cyanobacteria bacterium CYA]MCE7969743.1 GNAT family N-acetyltransferase [Leptolyngbya sp. PL-A3]
MTWAAPTRLENQFAILRPLALDDAAPLAAAAESLDTFRFYSRAPRDLSPDGMRAFLEFLMAQPNTSVFCVIEPTTRTPVGVTTYLDIRSAHRGLEIGWTWYTPRLRGGTLNPACKLLLLQHAFEDLGAIRVQLKTDERNARSRAAILKLGAAFEGVLRENVIMSDGFHRSTAMYSILTADWPAVRTRLHERLKILPRGTGDAAESARPEGATGTPPIRRGSSAPPVMTTKGESAHGPAAGNPPVTVSIARDHYRTTIDALGHTIIADEPASLGGRDAGPAPVDLLLSALGACKAITCRMYADRKGIPLDAMHVALFIDRPDQEHTAITARITLEGDLTGDQRQRLCEIASRCPVERTLTGTIKVNNELTA